VFCVDNLSSGNKENIKEFAALNSFVFLKHDMVDQIPLDSVDQIFNLACPASPVNYQKDPIKTIETCFFGALNALKLAENTGATVLQASTSEVYGDPLVHPQHETYWGHVNPIGTRACYDEGKRIAETLLFEYKRQRGVNIKCARIFNTYGPNMRVDDGRVVSNFLNQALLGNDITIYGYGRRAGSFNEFVEYHCWTDEFGQPR
jgi:UDP-glucuronate decarboxylase